MENRKGEAADILPLGGNSVARPIFRFLFPIFLVAIAAAGCAAPSEPTARHAPIPTAVTDLAAVQQGHRVILSFTLPKKTTDSKPLPADLSVEIYRQVVAAGAKPAAAPAFSQRELAVTIPSAMVSHYADSGHLEFPFELKTASVAQPPGEQTVFMVRTRVNEKKVSADSNPTSLHLYEPFPPANISAKITHDAIILSGWGVALPAGPSASSAESTQIPSDAHYRIFRAEAPANAAASPAQAGNENQSAPHLEQLAELPLTVMTYEDTNFAFDRTYIYSVRTVAKFGSTWIESDDSNLLAVTPKDIFPPSAPQGIVIVYVPAATGVPAHLEISWSISPETDLAGYDIYRKEQGNDTALKLNPRPLLTPSYRDMSIQPGTSYSYTVKAVDRAGNESPASEPASMDVPAAGEPDQNSQP
jgi:fibronectin type III domain protein